LNPYLSKSVMAKKNLSPQQIDLTRIALVGYLGLPPDRLKCGSLIGLSSPQVLKRALKKAVYDRRLTFSEAQEIASLIGVSLI